MTRPPPASGDWLRADFIIGVSLGLVLGRMLFPGRKFSANTAKGGSFTP